MDDLSSPTDHWFDPWATSEGPHLKAVSELIARQVLQGPTKRHQARIRQPKQEQVERVTNIVSSLMANLAVMHHGHPEHRRLAIPLRHDALSRYDRKGFGHLPHVIDTMAAMGLVVKHAAHIKKRRTGIEATGCLLEALLGVGAEGVGRAEGEETLWLFARAGRNAIGKKLPFVLVDYEETKETQRLRREMEEINTLLANQSFKANAKLPQGLPGTSSSATPLIRTPSTCMAGSMGASGSPCRRPCGLTFASMESRSPTSITPACSQGLPTRGLGLSRLRVTFMPSQA